MIGPRRCRAAATAALACLAALSGAEARGQVGPVPFEAGLRLSYTVNDRANEPDAVAHLTVLSADSAEAQLRLHWMRTGPPEKWYKYARPLSARERLSATAFHLFAGSEDRSSHRGYTWRMVSRRVLEQLLGAGEAEVTIKTGPAAASIDGRLRRVGREPVTYPVLLDGRPVELPGIPVRGRFSSPDLDFDLELLILEDPVAPWVLRSSWVTSREGTATRGRDQLTGITTRRSAEGLGRSLEESCVTTRYDILFATGSAALDSASAPVIEAIASALGKHRDWKLTIVGHTDGIGTAADNLELSRRRAESVRTVLIVRHGIPASRLRAEGRGESQPVADNATAEGRARNRRVDLERGCNPTSNSGGTR